MTSKFTVSVFVVVLMIIVGEGNIFERCELAKILVEKGFPRRQIPDWICLVQHESKYNSNNLGRNRNGSKDHGIFQINDDFWCNHNGPSKECNIQCSDLLDDNIDDDIECAKKIYKRLGFYAWYAWINNCKNEKLEEYVEGCDY